MKNKIKWAGFIGFFLLLLVIFPEFTFAAVGKFDDKVKRFTVGIISTVLPLVSTLGLVYGCILAVAGSVEAKSKIMTIIGMSLIGFLAPQIISWVQAFFM